jgi:dTDP-4-dehydrorhamnose reductase
MPIATGRPILVVGATGQVARALIERGRRRGAMLVALGRPALDLEKPFGLGSAIVDLHPAAIVNAAAYTAVDKAESEPERAFAINRDGAAALARAAAVLDVPFVHLSTDYVYDGGKPAPYVEEDPTGPAGVYGRSKLEGEQAVRAASPKAIVLRTAWVYSPYGNNFVKTILRLASERDRLRVVADQVGSPTSALDIAEAILTILARIDGDWQERYAGTYHLAGGGEASWCDLARATLAVAAPHGGRAVPVDAITTADYPTPARRPANSRLDTTRLAETFGVRLPPWRESLEETVARLLTGAV